MSVLLAEPTVSLPSSSLSRFSSVAPLHEGRVEPTRALARPTDLLVDRHQQLQRAVRQRLVLGQRHHRRDADAVVGAERRPVGGQPVAVADKRDPALGRIVGAVRRRSQTMSRCPCRTRTGADSRPAVAGTRTTRLRAASWRSSKPCSTAQSRTCSITGSSCRDGRAILVSASKCRQQARGSTPLSTALSVSHRGSLAVTGRCARRRPSCRASRPRRRGDASDRVRTRSDRRREARPRAISSHSMPRRICSSFQARRTESQRRSDGQHDHG